MTASRWRTPAAGVLSGALFALAFPPWEVVLLLPLALAPWIAALIEERRPGRALISGALFGLTYWCASISWISYVVTHYGGQGRLMGVVCLAILATILAQWPALVAFGVVLASRPRSRWRVAAFPVLWMASEHARSFVYGGFPWNLTATALYRHPVWLQTASIWGAIGVGGWIAGVSSLLAASAVARSLRLLVAATLAVLALGIGGAIRLSRPEPVPEVGQRLSVALLQPNVSQDERLVGGEAAAYETVLAQLRQAAAAGTDLIVVPESAFPVYWDRSPTLRRDLSAIGRVSAVIFNDIEEEPGGKYYNVARLLGADGLEGEAYRKVHLVPFGEYVPLPRIFFFVRQVSTEIGEFSAAAEPTTLHHGPVRIGAAVCYEITYPDLVRREVRPLGANLLVTISNDSWYGRAGAQAQHFSAAVARAVETHRCLLRAAITGISGIVDEKGRIRAELGRDRPGILRGSARLSSVATPWTRWGYLLPVAADALAAGVLLFGLARWKRLSPGREEPGSKIPR